jgi:hypothetical protein
MVRSVPPSLVGSYHGDSSRPESAAASSDNGSVAQPVTGGLGALDTNAASQMALVGPTSWQLLFDVRRGLL